MEPYEEPDSNHLHCMMKRIWRQWRRGTSNNPNCSKIETGKKRFCCVIKSCLGAQTEQTSIKKAFGGVYEDWVMVDRSSRLWKDVRAVVSFCESCSFVETRWEGRPDMMHAYKQTVADRNTGYGREEHQYQCTSIDVRYGNSGLGDFRSLKFVITENVLLPDYSRLLKSQRVCICMLYGICTRPCHTNHTWTTLY